MIQVDRTKFKKNYKNVLFLILIFVVLFAIFFPLTKDSKISNIESDLEKDGDPNISKLVINEVMNNNGSVFADEEGNIYDWVELYNGSNKEINLNGYSLSDDENKDKWFFNNITIKPKSYLIVYLSGDTKDGLYANFKLSKNGGEKLILKDIHGKVIDMVETVKTNKNTSLARNLDGKWNIVKKATPGFNNTEDGYNEFIESLNSEDISIQITEVLPRNGGQFIDDYGNYSGYIELTNTSDVKINLKGYSLSDSINKPFKWSLPEIIINPNERILIFTSGRDITEGILHTSFNLNSKNGEVILSKNGKIVQNLEYQNLPNGYALALVDEEYKRTGTLSGGFENNAKGNEAFAKKYEQNNHDLMINEVMNNNFEYLPQNGYEFYDWIELKNNSNETINLKDYYITTSLSNLELYRLPDIELKPNELYVIMASGDPNLTNNSYYHANFKISDSESLYIIKDNKIVDSMFIYDVKPGYSFGRKDDYGFIYMETPTPNRNNNSGKYEVAYSPEFSINAGIYDENLVLEIKAPGTIYYTVDGSIPTTSSYVYSEPINLNKTTVVKAMSIEEGKVSSNYSVASYIINENHTLPVVSVSLNPYKFNTLQSYIWNEELEYDAYVELFEDGKGFSVPCGFKLFGGSTRGMDKKSFALKFRKEYGLSKLHYQVFENRDNSSYNTLVLRSGSQDSEAAMMRDPLMTSLMEGTAVDVQAYKPVVLYINGNYWGIYYIREKVDDDFIASHYNVDPDKTNIVRIDGLVSEGSKEGYDEIINYVNNHDMRTKENYEYIKEKINIDSLITFWVAETYITNNDIINCRFFSHPDIDNGRWHLIFYDLDYAMYNANHNYYYFMTDINGMSDFAVPTDLMRNLLRNEEFRDRFVEILSDMLNNVWTDENILNKIDEIYEIIEPEMERNQKRWNQTMSDWNKSVDELKSFVARRKTSLLNQTKSYFGLTEEEMKKHFGDIYA